MKSQLIGALLLLTASDLLAGVNPRAGTSGFSLLSNETTARLSGMGRAHVAVSNDVQAVFSNPAGLGIVQDPELGSTYRNGVEGISYSQVSFVLPLSGISAQNVNNFGTLGVTYSHLDFGDFIGQDASGNDTQTFKANDHSFGVVYGKKLFTGLSAGLKFNFFNSEIDNVKANGTSTDFGIHFRPNDSIWSTGVVVQNTGGQTSYDGINVKPGEILLMGAALRPLRGDQLIIALDAVDSSDDSLGVRSGVEWWPCDLIALRGGYDSTDQSGSGFTAGLGLQVQNFETFFIPAKRFRLDYAFSSANNLSREGSSSSGFHQVSLSFQFGEDGYIKR